MPNPIPTFADDALAWASTAKRHSTIQALRSDAGRKAYTQAASQIAQLIQRAARFSFDDGFLDHVVDVASTINNTAKIEAVMSLARAPHPVTWIEFSADERIRRQHATGTMPQYSEAELNLQPRRAAFLIEALNDVGSQYVVRYLTSETRDGDDSFWSSDHVAAPMLLVDVEATQPFVRLGQYERLPVFDDGSDEDYALRALPYGFRAKAADATFGATTYGATGTFRMVSMCAVAMSDHIAAYVSDYPEKVERLTKLFLKEHADGRGDLRFIACALAIINRLPVRYDIREPKGSRWANGRPRPYLSHRTVTLTVPATRSLSMFGRLVGRAASEITRRAHEVRGHWRTIPDLKAGGTREVWIKSHQRGDATKGFVRTDYAVQTSADKRTEH